MKKIKQTLPSRQIDRCVSDRWDQLVREGLVQLSASRIKLYAECRYRFYLQYVAGKDVPAHPSTILGSAVHYAIERFFIAQEDLYSTFLAKMDELDRNREHVQYLSEGLQILKQNDLSVYRPRVVELPFVEQFTENTFVLGFFDLLDERDWIVDFKTSQRKPAVIDHDIQFALYAWSYERLFHRPPARVIYHHLRTNTQIDADIDALIEDTLPRARRIAELIVSDHFDDVNVCVRCKPYCPFFTERSTYESGVR